MCANKRGFYNHDSNEIWKNRDAIIINLALQSGDSIICRLDVTLAQTSVVGKARTHKTCKGITFYNSKYRHMKEIARSNKCDVLQQVREGQAEQAKSLLSTMEF